VAVEVGGEASGSVGYAGVGKPGKVSWGGVAEKLLRAKEAVLERIGEIDFVEARKGIIAAFGIDEANIVDHVWYRF
jgi:hypothetical protein